MPCPLPVGVLRPPDAAVGVVAPLPLPLPFPLPFVREVNMCADAPCGKDVDEEREEAMADRGRSSATPTAELSGFCWREGTLDHQDSQSAIAWVST